MTGPEEPVNGEGRLDRGESKGGGDGCLRREQQQERSGGQALVKRGLERGCSVEGGPMGWRKGGASRVCWPTGIRTPLREGSSQPQKMLYQGGEEWGGPGTSRSSLIICYRKEDGRSEDHMEKGRRKCGQWRLSGGINRLPQGLVGRKVSDGTAVTRGTG